MIKRTYRQIVQMAQGTPYGAPSNDVLVAGVSKDTRTLTPGSLYVPIIGERFDGHDYVQDAFRLGAAASLWQEDRPDRPEGVPLILVDDTLAALQRLAGAYRRQLPVRVIGITGSNGKTTTKDLTSALLATTYNVLKTSGNLNSQIGLPMMLLELAEDTEVAVLEMGMSARGQIELLSRIAEPDAAVLTIIGESHMQDLGSREEIARAKTEILGGLREGGLFVYNGDEPLIDKVLPEMPQPASMLRLRFGFSDTNDMYPVATMQEAEGTRFQSNLPGAAPLYVPLLGRHNVLNALAAIAVAKYMGVAEADIERGFAAVETSGMRVERVLTQSGAVILNDAYNASPTSMRAAIELLQELKGYKRKIVVLGDMLELGPAGAEYHKEIGGLLHPDHIDAVYTFGRLGALIAGEAEGRFGPGRVGAFSSKDRLIETLTRSIGAGDLVLVKGSRGMKLEEVVDALSKA